VLTSSLALKMSALDQRDGRVQPHFRKTELCRFFSSKHCSKGRFCDFAHGEDDLRSPPNLNKTSICKDWRRKQCKLRAEQCPFAHGKRELRSCQGLPRETDADVKPEKLQNLKVASDLPTTLSPALQQQQKAAIKEHAIAPFKEESKTGDKAEVFAAVDGQNLYQEHLVETKPKVMSCASPTSLVQAVLLSVGSVQLARQAAKTPKAGSLARAWMNHIMSLKAPDLDRLLVESMPDHYDE